MREWAWHRAIIGYFPRGLERTRPMPGRVDDPVSTDHKRRLRGRAPHDGALCRALEIIRTLGEQVDYQPHPDCRR